MTSEIEVTELPPSAATEIVIQPAKAQGWMGWYSSATGDMQGGQYWMQIYPSADAPNARDPYRCPYPLFETREAAVNAGAKALSNGGQLRIVKITL